MEIKIGKDTYVTTWNNSLSDFQDKTLVPVDSPLFRRVSQMSVGQAVRFSGEFVHDDLDFAREKSMSVSGAMTNRSSSSGSPTSVPCLRCGSRKADLRTI